MCLPSRERISNIWWGNSRAYYSGAGTQQTVEGRCLTSPAEIRNPKVEIRRNPTVAVFRVSVSFGFRASGFGFRILIFSHYEPVRGFFEILYVYFLDSFPILS